MQIEQIAISELIPFARNSRTHSDAQVAQIAASIREFGFTNPVLIDAQACIIAGHGRVLAARKLQLAEVPCLRLSHLTETQKRAYVIADNKLALNAGWDEDMLKIELEGLLDDGFDLELTGFTDDEILLIGIEDEADEIDDEPTGDAPKGNLSDRFMIPPFTVLNAREGWWQNRKKAWLALGIKSELGRGGAATWNVNPDNTPTQRQAAAPGPRATTAISSAATARGER